MVGPWGLEPQTSTVSKRLYYARPTTSRPVRSGLVRVSTPKPELLQVKLQVKKFVWNPSGARATAQGLFSKHNVDSRKQ